MKMPDLTNIARSLKEGLERKNPLLPKPVLNRLDQYRGRILGTIGLATALTGSASYLTRPELDEFDFPHQGEAFTIDDLTTEEKVAQLLHGSLYDSRTGDLVDRVLNHRRSPLPEDFSDWITDPLKTDENLGGVHLFRSDARSLDEARRTILEVMSQNKIPPFVSMDIVGGYTRHLGLTHAEAKAYGVPDEFLEMARAKGIELPAQEDLGRAFEKLKTNRERTEFRIQMEHYGEAIAKLCRDLGISINFSPVMDLVADKDGENFMEKNDEAYSDQLHTVMVLSFHFIKGFQKENNVLIAPKHFAGTGKLSVNPHDEEEQVSSGMTHRDGSFLPFVDAIKGTLFTRQIHSSYGFDRDLRYARNSGKSTEKISRNHKVPPHWIDSSFTTMDPVRGLMVGHAQTFMDKGGVPGTLSETVVEGYLQKGLGFDGIAWSDDLSMSAVEMYASSQGCQTPLNSTGAIFVQALSSGITMPMFLHRAGELEEITTAVETAIEEKTDNDKDGKADLTMEMINERVEKVLEQKVALGLLKVRRSPQGDVYSNNAQNYLQ